LVHLAGKGFMVFSVDLRGLGFSIPRLPSAGPVFYHGDNMQEDYAWASFSLGKPVLGQRVWDCLRSLEYLKSRPDVARERIYGLGDRGGAIALLMAGVLDANLRSLVLDSSIASYRSLVESEAYSLQLPWFLYGILRHFDLPDLVGALAPRSCWLLNSTDAMGKALPESNLAAIFHHSIATYKSSGANKGLRLSVCTDQLKQKMLDKWLEST
jgi:pimeloyl-ACP methyl ester carboxylesterase